MAPHSSTLACKIPWIEEPGGLQSMGSLSSQTRLHFHFSVSCIGEGNGKPLQCFCLENPRDSRAWWAAVSGVAQDSSSWIHVIIWFSKNIFSLRKSEILGHLVIKRIWFLFYSTIVKQFLYMDVLLRAKDKNIIGNEMHIDFVSA